MNRYKIAKKKNNPGTRQRSDRVMDRYKIAKKKNNPDNKRDKDKNSTPLSYDEVQADADDEELITLESTMMNSEIPLKHLSDGSLEGKAPTSSHFIITGPGGYRIFIPIHNLDIKFDHISSRSTIELTIHKKSARALESEIQACLNRNGIFRRQ